MANWLRESWPNLLTLPTMCRKSSWYRIRKASEWHHKCLYLSRDVMTPGVKQDSRIWCHTWAMYFLLRADLCRFKHGVYLRSFMRLLNKWLPSTCCCPLSHEELGESPVCVVLPSSFIHSGRGCGQARRDSERQLLSYGWAQVLGEHQAWLMPLVMEWEFQWEMEREVQVGLKDEYRFTKWSLHEVQGYSRRSWNQARVPNPGEIREGSFQELSGFLSYLRWDRTSQLPSCQLCAALHFNSPGHVLVMCWPLSTRLASSFLPCYKYWRFHLQIWTLIQQEFKQLAHRCTRKESNRARF